MSKEFVLFEKDEILFSEKYLRLMDLLVTNKSTSRVECMILFGIFYLQIITGFFSEQLNIINPSMSGSNQLLNYIEKIIRIKDLFLNNYTGFQIALTLIFIALILLSIYIIYLTFKITKDSFYTYKEVFLNFFLKIFIYIAFIPILDLCLANICFEEINPNFSDKMCSDSQNSVTLFIGIILFLYSIFFCLFITCFYSDSQFLSNSYYALMSYPYENYITLNNILSSILLSQSKYIGQEVFLIYNVIISLIFLRIYFTKYIFYDLTTNKIVGIFHILYSWTSLFFFVFYYLETNDRGVIYIISSIIIVFLYFNLKDKLEEDIILKTPFHKISNKYYLLFYLKTILDKINNFESSAETKAKLVGIIQIHITECPNPDCITKDKKKKIYLPITNEWTDRSKHEINDRVFLLNLLLIILNYFIQQSFYSPDMLINLSLYYLTVVGNYCQSMLIYKKIKEMKLSFTEKFSFNRLNFVISKMLIEKLRPPNEVCNMLDDLNCTLYFKYDDLSHKFFEEMNNDINLSLEFWRCFKGHNETNRPLDFNKVFTLTDKIRITKSKIEKIWSDLYNTYSGVNDLFELYENYVEQINDDDLQKRELDTIRSKSNNSTEHIQLNFYNILFNKETGIIIANGDKSKEGIIEKTNEEIERIFLYKADELKGLNVSYLMPKIFQKQHKSFMERYCEIGEKRIIDKNFHAFAKDKESTLVPISLCVKLFPMLCEHIYYCALITRDNLDDAILIDKDYIIQGMTRKLLSRFDIDHKTIFYQIDFPFYIICKDFIKFYTTYINPNKVVNNTSALFIDQEERNKRNEEQEIENNIDNINETLELEYSLKIPQFLLDYISIVQKRESKMDLKLMKSSSIEDETNEVTVDNFDEGDALVEEGVTTEGNTNQKLNLTKQNDEDKEFLSKIEYIQGLFKKKKYDDLEEEINKLRNETSTKEHRFNFNFSLHRFGDNNKAFIIRCMDNKNEIDDIETDSDESKKDGKITGRSKICKYGKIKSFTEFYEHTHDDRENIIKNQNDYANLTSNKEFQKISSQFKQEISDYSKIFGIKKDDAILDEESASQNSAAGFNESLSKKSRIEEIRSNIMKNISNFFALKWIKLIFLLILIITAGFSGCYLIIYSTMYETIDDLSKLSVTYFQSTIWLSNIVSSLISMRSVYEFKKNNDTINFNSYIPNMNDYFDNLRENSKKWYNNISQGFGLIEQKMNLYYVEDDKPLWNNHIISYPSNSDTIKDYESFPLGLSQSLSADNKLLQSSIFSYNTTDYPLDEVNRIKYSSYISIENTINNIIPMQLKLLDRITSDFQSFNSKNMIYVLIIILSYGMVMMLLSLLYMIFLYFTNKNMQEGFEKASQIKTDKIDETIKRIENFNDKFLSKFRQKELRSLDDFKEMKNDFSGVNSGIAQAANQLEKYKNFNTDSKKYKNLNILNYSYLQVVFLLVIISAVLVPLYFVSLSMITDSNQILAIQAYIFGKLVYATHSTVNIKCQISDCKINLLDYKNTTELLNPDDIENIVREISNFPLLSEFYNKKFLLNACLVIFEKDSPDYTKCMNDTIIKSANNTDSLLKLMDETVSIIEKDKEMKTNKFINTNGINVKFTNKYLYETNFFNELESVFYNYVTPISDKFAKVIDDSLYNYLETKKITIIIMVVIFAIVIMIFAVYVIFVFIQKLIHLLSVSRCILRIIPTSVITNTNELESWIESKY